MDRIFVYPGQIPLDTDALNIQLSTMVALGFLAQATVGTGTYIDGLACTPGTGLNVTVAPGSIFSLQDVDATAFGSLPADTSDSIVKIGSNLTSTTIAVAAPGTAGQSINYLIEAQFSEVDGGAVVLPYYNAASPTTPYAGPGNSGSASNTTRTQRVALVLKAGAAATTGTQTTPGVDAGYVGLWVVTVTNGQSSVPSGQIVQYSSAPFLTAKVGNARRKLSANLNIYVSTAGSDSNDGQSAGSAFQTLQRAWTYLMQSVDLGGYSATVNIADGSYSAGVFGLGQPVGWDAGSSIAFVGNTSSPGNVTISVTSGNCFQFNAAFVNINGMTLTATGTGGNGNLIVAGIGAQISWSNIVFGSAAGFQMWAYDGQIQYSSGTYAITGGAVAHLSVTASGYLQISGPVTATVTGTPNFSSAFAQAVDPSTIYAPSVTYSGAATGLRYSATLNGVINTNGGGASYFPGSTAGSTVTGGQYV